MRYCRECAIDAVHLSSVAKGLFFGFSFVRFLDSCFSGFGCECKLWDRDIAYELANPYLLFSVFQ